MPIVKKPGSPYLWYDFRFNGRRYRGTTGQTNRTAAQSIEAALMTQLAAGQPTRHDRRAPYLIDYAPSFLALMSRSQRLASKTKLYYINGWRLLKPLDIARMRMDTLTPDQIETVRIGSGANTNCALRTLRRMLNTAERDGILRRAPRFSLVEETGRDRLITPDEEQLILLKASPTLRDAFMLTLDTGMRTGEIAAMEWTNVDLIDGTIKVPVGKTKNAKRTVEMTGRVREMLILRAKAFGGRWVFPSTTAKRFGEHIRTGSIICAFVELKHRLGLSPDLVYYSARHTFGTDLQQACGDLTVTAKSMGHGSTKMTERYVHASARGVGKMMDERNATRQ